MRRILLVLSALLGTFVIAVPALAGSPHFISSAFHTTISGNTVTVSGKEAGLGAESQVHITVTATAACINNGGKHPKAVNKASFSAAGDFPVQNGKADFELSLTATFQPDCSPPMTVSWSSIVVRDTTNGLVVAL
jgi:hypothetical protein